MPQHASTVVIVGEGPIAKQHELIRVTILSEIPDVIGHVTPRELAQYSDADEELEPVIDSERQHDKNPHNNVTDEGSHRT